MKSYNIDNHQWLHEVVILISTNAEVDMLMNTWLTVTEHVCNSIDTAETDRDYVVSMVF